MNALQVIAVILYVAGSVGILGLLVVALLILRRVSEYLAVSRDLMRLAVANSEDARRKTDRIEQAAAVVTKAVAVELPAKLVEVKQSVDNSAPSPPWKPGDPDPRHQNLGPAARGKGNHP